MRICRFLLSVIFILSTSAVAKEVDFYILAGQSNAQGWKGDAKEYPVDTWHVDKEILFYWYTPKHSSSHRRWRHLQAQPGRFNKGHFGPEVSFARARHQEGRNPAIFKFTLGGTGLQKDWKKPGENGLYDHMVHELKCAISLLKNKGLEINFKGFIWIQGESDAKSKATSSNYGLNLAILIDHLRIKVLGTKDMPVLIGVDEQHPFVAKNKDVLFAQKSLAKFDNSIGHTSMYGLEKADATHVTPSALIQQGLRLHHDLHKISSR